MPFQKGHPGGPGRPRKADQHAGAIAKAEKQIRDRLPWLIDKQFELADGVWREQILPDGETRIIYQEKPDYRALSYLIDRIMGKPTERKELTGEDGAPLFPDFERALNKAYADSDDTTGT